jgi:hypothetical protein
LEVKNHDVRLKLSLEFIKEEVESYYEKDKFHLFQDFIHISNLIIPFSIIFRKDVPLDIYSGNELIPFEEKDPIFKQILKNEFVVS